MGMSTHVIGFKPPNNKWIKMKAIYDSCKDAGIKIPIEVIDYFEGVKPDGKGVEVKIKAKVWTDENSASGYEVDLEQIDKDIKIIRFYNSW